MELILKFVIFASAGGAIGAAAMNVFMRLISRNQEQQVNMVEALASLFTGTTENAMRVGTIIHLSAGVFFGMAYTLVFIAAQADGLPLTFLLGAGIGFAHGLIFSYVLMFVASERHPIERYRNATFATGVIHLIGHVVFGMIVGVIVGLAPGLT